MMKKISNILKKYKISIFIATVILIIGIIGLIIMFLLINKDSKIKEFKNDNCKFKYDTSWTIKSEENDKITLIHKSKSELELEIVKLEDEYKYSNIDNIFDELVYDISIQNEEFSLISTKEEKITKNKYSGYKLLYESDGMQAMLAVAKSSDKLILFTYKADNEYFDILLDSVHNIIYNYEILDSSFALQHNLNIETSKIEWKDNKEVTNTINKNIEYELASNNYLVKLSVPSNFKYSKFDSSWLYLDYEGLSDTYSNITLSASIYNTNVYEEIDSGMGVGTIFYQYKSMREGTSSYYYDFKENLEEMNNNEESYIYKTSYKSKTELGTETKEHYYEDVHLIYSLDKNHIITVTLTSREVQIPLELINKIKVISSTNYSSYVKKNVKDSNLVGQLKHFTDYNKDKVEVITLKVPKKYEEIDKDNNMYSSRYYGLNYNEENEIYRYEVEYNIDTFLTTINSSYESLKAYGEYKLLTYIKDVELNGKKFQLYEGGYTELGGALFSSEGRKKYYVTTNVLVYNISNNKTLLIHIKGNGTEISDTLLNELTNFDIEIENY